MRAGSSASLEVSIVVPTCRRPELLARCLSALVEQDFDPAAYEIIVVDDGPSEATRRLVEEWPDLRMSYCYVLEDHAPASTVALAVPGNNPRAAPDFERSWAKPSSRAQAALIGILDLPKLRYMQSQGGHGPAVARNTGWRSAEAPVIAFTDDDCIPAPDWLQKGLQAMRDGVVGVSGRTIVPLPDRPRDYERDVSGLARSLFITANCFYRRSALVEAGGFDERFQLAWREDSDLFFTLLEQQAGLAEEPEALVVHPIRPAPWGISLKQQRRSSYNALLYKKHPRNYRRWVQPSPPWRYYAILAALLVVPVGALARQEALTLAGAGAWLGLTLRFALLRLRDNAKTSSHMLEMLVTSALIPPLSVYWRLRGAIEHRVLFF